MRRTYIVGADLGQATDYTSATVIEKITPLVPDANAEYHVRMLRRLSLGTPYPEVVGFLWRLWNSDELSRGKNYLAVDATGVGRPVVQMIELGVVKPYAVTIHSGDAVARPTSHDLRIPKRELITNLQVLFQQGQLMISKKIKEAQLLLNELINFKMKITLAGNATYEAWRDSAHDDLVLAVAVAAWVAVNVATLSDGYEFDGPRVRTVMENYLVGKPRAVHHSIRRASKSNWLH